ncbi:MAG: hypothetical protein WDW36_006385 [Sanguina aurantia]
MSGRMKLIIDTDPGVDDAMAILCAFQSASVEVIALTTIFGNVPTPLATANALRLVEMAGVGHKVPVCQGATVSSIGAAKLRIADFVHGSDGFGNTLPPAPTGVALVTPAAQFIVQAINAAPGEITLLALGPLTNIAAALALDPGIASKWATLVILGGAFFCNGNVNPAAEANIFGDPQAADAVMAAVAVAPAGGVNIPLTATASSLSATPEPHDSSNGSSSSGGGGGSSVPPPAHGVTAGLSASGPSKPQHCSGAVRVVGLDVTHSCLMTAAQLDHLASCGPVGSFVHSIAQFYLGYHRSAYQQDSIFLHDPTAFVAGPGMGHTIVDASLREWIGSNPWTERGKVDVATAVDAPAVVQIVMELLAAQGPTMAASAPPLCA